MSKYNSQEFYDSLSKTQQWVFDRGREVALEEAQQQAAAQVREAALLEAAKAECPSCRLDWKFKPGTYSHYLPHGGTVTCDASAIRQLMATGRESEAK